MPCFYPLAAYRSGVTDQGKVGVVFSRPPGWIGRPISLPCGKCVGCLLSRSREWAVKCVHESLMHDVSSFVTLTFDDVNVPSSGVSVRDVQLFVKRLRAFLSRPAGLPAGTASPRAGLRYFAVGEYGAEFGRPHYHLLLFGFNFSSDRVPLRGRGRFQLFSSAFLDRVWQHRGMATIGDMTFESAAYCARYSLKKFRGLGADVVYDGLGKEFVCMSRSLGRDYIARYWKEVYAREGGSVVVKGKELMPPKAYDRYLEKVDPDLRECVRMARVRARLENPPDVEGRRGWVREQVLKAQIDLGKRRVES